MDYCSRTRCDPINNYIMAVQNMLEATEGMLYLLVLRCYSVEIVLYLKVLEGVLCVSEMLESVRRIPEAVENSALYAGGTAGDALSVLTCWRLC